MEHHVVLLFALKIHGPLLLLFFLHFIHLSIKVLKERARRNNIKFERNVKMKG